MIAEVVKLKGTIESEGEYLAIRLELFKGMDVTLKMTEAEYSRLEETCCIVHGNPTRMAPALLFRTIRDRINGEEQEPVWLKDAMADIFREEE
jgi:hypothetical protein